MVSLVDALFSAFSPQCYVYQPTGAPLLAGKPTITSITQVHFEPPDQDWRTQVRGLANVALNIYLVDLRENRKLREQRNPENARPFCACCWLR